MRKYYTLLISLLLLLTCSSADCLWKFNPHTGKLDYYEAGGTAPLDVTHWNSAYNWTNAGRAHWDAAYMWGNHALAHYLTTEVDGIVGNEVTNVADNTLLRTGLGTTASPFLLGLNLNRANVWTADQTVPGLTIGTGAAGVDYTLTFNGQDSDGKITWMEDEAMFDFDSYLYRLAKCTDSTNKYGYYADVSIGDIGGTHNSRHAHGFITQLYVYAAVAATNNFVYGQYNNLAGVEYTGVSNAHCTGVYNCFFQAPAVKSNVSLIGVDNFIISNYSMPSYGTRNVMSTTAGGTAEEIHGVSNRLITYDVGDVGYGGYFIDTGNSTGGTQYGIYIDVDDPDVTNHSIYVASGSGDSYFGSGINLDGILRCGSASLDDFISIDPPVKGANQFTGTITSEDLTAARTWTMKNESGTVPFLESNNTWTANTTYQGTQAADSIVNGDFDTDTDWTKGAGWTIAGGVAVATNAAGNLLEIVSTVVPGKEYELEYDCTITSGTARILAGGFTSGTLTTGSGTDIKIRFYAVTTGAVTFDGVSLFNATIDNVSLREIVNTVDYKDTLITSTTGPIEFKNTLDNNQGDEAAMHLSYTTNKATSGNDMGLLVDMYDLSSPGTSYLIEGRTGGASIFSISSLGVLSCASTFSAGGSVGAGGNVSAGERMYSSHTNPSTTGAVYWAPTITNTGSQVGLRLAPTYNQASGNPANTELLINRTETNVGGTGAQKFIDMQQSGTPWYTFFTGNTAVTGAFNAASGVEYGVSLKPNFSSQTGTAGYTAFEVDATDGGGSGVENLADFQLGNISMLTIGNTGSTSIYGDGLGAAPVLGTFDRLGLLNTTPAVAGPGVTEQQGPALRFESHAWETTGGTDDKQEWRIYPDPATGSTSTSTLKFGFSKDSAAETFPATLTNAGALTTLSSVTSGGFTTTGNVGFSATSYCSTAAPSTATGFGVSSSQTITVPKSDIIVIDSATNKTRQALTTDTTAICVGVQNLYASIWGGYTLVNIDSSAVAIGDQLVISNVADGCARPLNTNTDSRITVGRALSAKAAGDNAVYVSHDAGTEIITVNGTASTWVANQRVVVMDTGIGPGIATIGGLLNGTAYYIYAPAGAPTTTFQLVTASGGTSPINLSAGGGVGTITFEPTGVVSIWLSKATKSPLLNVMRTTTQTVTDSTGLVADDTLILPVIAGGRYHYRAEYYFTDVATSGIKCDMGGGSCTITNWQGSTDIKNLITYGVIGGGETTAATTAIGVTITETSVKVVMEGAFIANAAGTLAPRFAQNLDTGAGESVIAKVGSTLTLEPLP